jgi:sugar phosphate isomerase/epimerase
MHDPNATSPAAVQDISPGIADYLASKGAGEKLGKWVATQFQLANGGLKLDPATSCRVVALATYLPAITSLHENRREKAVKAVSNCARAAIHLHRIGMMDHPIVEMVCGSILDSCECPKCRRDSGPDQRRGHRCLASSHSDKWALLIESLTQIMEQVMQTHPDDSFALALEIEPGETYVLNDLTSVKWVIEQVKSSQLLAGRVGLNLDVAHARIIELSGGNMSADKLREFQNFIVHSHICDHPGMHTRDQEIGTWTSVFSPDGGYYPYTRLLLDRARQASQSNGKGILPFSGAISLELEGCNRIEWVHRSLTLLKHVIETTRNWE